MQAVYVEQTKMEVSVSRDEIVLCGCMCVDMGMQPKRERLDIKKSEVEANWTVRNASICPLQRTLDSCKEDTSGHLIMQIPKVHWPLRP